jgi:hypothetical protein
VSRPTIQIRFVWLLVPTLVLTLLALPSFGYAAPPDQTWLAGLYDDADHDNVVLEIANASAVQPLPALRLRVPEAIGQTHPLGPRAAPSRIRRSALLDRSPPWPEASHVRVFSSASAGESVASDVTGGDACYSRYCERSKIRPSSLARAWSVATPTRP